MARSINARQETIDAYVDVYPIFGEVPGLLYHERAAAASWREADTA